MEKKKRKLSKKAQENPHYVNNKDFTEAIAKWIKENEGKKSRKEWTSIPNYVAECFLKIIEHYGLKGRWRGYTYLDEMKSEAILNCVKYAHNFKIEKSDNAFAYFTQYVENSFRQVWNDEDKQSKIKYESISKDSEYNYEKINLYDEEHS